MRVFVETVKDLLRASNQGVRRAATAAFSPKALAKSFKSLWADAPKDLAGDSLRSLHFLTRLPLPTLAYKPFSDLVAAIPLASAALALAFWALAHGLWWIWGGAPWLAAGLLLAVQTLVTGALHDDALADTADGLGGGHSKDHKLAIMRDSHVGSYGLVATVLSFGLRWSAWALIGPALGLMLSLWLLSRWACLPSMAWQTAARPGASEASNQGGQAAAAGRASRPWVGVTGLGVAVIASLLTTPLILLALLPAATLAWMAQRQLGGVTGDIYGAQMMLTEIGVLLIWAAWLS